MSKKTIASYLIKRSTGKKLRINGCLPSVKKPPKFKQYSARRFSAAELPERVDLRNYMTRVEDQGEVGSCTANAIAGAYEYLAKRALGDAGDISRLFIYYNARKYDGLIGDVGSSITTSIRVLEDIGACTEITWPYDPTLWDEEPHTDAYNEATQFLVDEALEIPVDLFSMKHCLAEGYPFAFGLKLFKSFDRASRKGGVPLPDPNDQKGRKEHGNHAMLCVGYSDPYQVFVVRNSWGENWGDQGYCYIPYSYMTNPQYCWDCWTIRAVNDLDFSAGVWVEDDEDFYVYDEESEDEYEEDPYIEDEEIIEDSYTEDDEDEDDDEDDEYDDADDEDDEYDGEDDEDDEYDDEDDEYDDEDDEYDDEDDEDDEYDDEDDE